MYFKKSAVPGVIFGAGLGYAFGGPDLVSLGIGAAAGYFVYPPVQNAVVGEVSTFKERQYIVPAVLGGLIGYQLYFGDLMFTGAGAAAGAAVEYAINKY